MRRRPLGLLAAWVLAAFAVTPAATPQDTTDGIPTYHWAGRTFGIPLDLDRLPAADRPTHIQLFTRTPRGNWQPGRKIALANLDELDGGKKGILLKDYQDGTYDVAAQFSYADGSTSPRTDELSPQRRVVIDLTPPRVRVTAVGNGVEWSVTDDNVDPAFAVLQSKFPQWTEWKTVDRQFRAADKYAWQLQPGQVLEVRVKGRDKAGNETWSPIIRVPGNGSVGGGSDWPPRGGGDPLTAPGFGGGAGVSNLPQPRIDYSNTREFEIDYTIQRVGPSGIQAAHLYVLKDQGTWAFSHTEKVDIKPTDRDKPFSLKYKAEKDGTYGFYVAPESGAGNKADQPRPGDPPMMLVVVDTQKPYVKITGAQVRAGTGRGPVVDITWEVGDPNLMAAPINLEWSVDRAATAWKEIKARLNQAPNVNTGRFSWEVPEETPWKFWVRIRATDKAGNTGEFVWDKEVIIDLEKPAAGINKIRSGNTEPDKLPAAPGGTTTGSPGGPGGSPPTVPKLPDPDKYGP